MMPSHPVSILLGLEPFDNEFVRVAECKLGKPLIHLRTSHNIIIGNSGVIHRP